MIQQLPPLNGLRAFESAARHLSFSKAAEELHVTPAAISHQIKSLEDLLGFSLFHRLNRGLALTPAARDCLPLLSRGFRDLGEAVRQLRRHEHASRALTLGVAPSFAGKWLLPRLDRFYNQQPDVELQIIAGRNLIDSWPLARRFGEDFRDDDLDLAIRFGLGDYPGCRVDKLMSATAAPLCSPELLARRPLRTPQDLRHHRLLHDATAYENRPDWQAWLQRFGGGGIDADRGVYFNHAALALEAAVGGQGVVLTLLPLAAADLAAGRLVKPFAAKMELQLSAAYYLITPPANDKLPQVVAFRRWLLDEAHAAERGRGGDTPETPAEEPSEVLQ